MDADDCKDCLSFCGRRGAPDGQGARVFPKGGQEKECDSAKSPESTVYRPGNRKRAGRSYCGGGQAGRKQKPCYVDSCVCQDRGRIPVGEAGDLRRGSA